MAGFSYGGQAILEGVMIRGPQSVSIAVRRPDGEIALDRRSFKPLYERWPVLGLPLLRGSVALYEALRLGTEALMFSANQVAESEDEKLGRGEMFLTTLLAFALAIGLFVLAPTGLVILLQRWIQDTLVLNLVEGAIRLVILLAYIAAIARMPDIRRVLEYHGAEHKVIHALEAEDRLTVDEARKYSVLHPRCGTSFLLFVALVSIVLYAFFGWPDLLERIAIRLGMLPVVAGIAYEFIRAAGRSRSPFWQAMSLPGMWLQRLTTREPDDQQIEVALTALEGALNYPSEMPVA